MGHLGQPSSIYCSSSHSSLRYVDAVSCTVHAVSQLLVRMSSEEEEPCAASSISHNLSMIIIYPSIYDHHHLSIYDHHLSTYLSIYLSIISIYLSTIIIYLSIYLSIISIYLSIYDHHLSMIIIHLLSAMFTAVVTIASEYRLHACSM